MSLDYFPLLQYIEIQCWNYSIQRPWYIYTNQTSCASYCFLLTANVLLLSKSILVFPQLSYSVEEVYIKHLNVLVFFLLTWTKGLGDFFFYHSLSLSPFVCILFTLLYSFLEKKEPIWTKFNKSHFL